MRQSRQNRMLYPKLIFPTELSF